MLVIEDGDTFYPEGDDEYHRLARIDAGDILRAAQNLDVLVANSDAIVLDPVAHERLSEVLRSHYDG